MTPDAQPEPDECYIGDGSAVGRCVSCGRAFCERHRATSAGIARTVFGPFFDDKRPRCDDCAVARFWRGALALSGIIGLVVGIQGVATHGMVSLVGGAALAVVGGGFSAWRARTFERRARMKR